MYVSMYLFEVSYCQKPMSEPRVPISVVRVTGDVA